MRRWWQHPRWPDVLALLSLGLWPLIYFWPVAIGARVFFGHDIPDLIYPLRMELANALREGRLPLWTTYAQSGFPVLAAGQIAALYPLNLLLYRLLPVHLALSYSILFHLAWSAVGMYLFCRSAGLRVAGALLAGFVFEFGGFALAHIQHLDLQATASWLPWLLLFQNQMQRALRDGQRRWLLWFALTSVSIGIQFVSGHTQLVSMNLLPFSLASVLGPALWNRPYHLPLRGTARPILVSLALTLLSTGLGVGLAAVQWLPTAELLRLSVRAQELGLGFFTSLSLPPAALVQFLFPFAPLGAPTDYNMEYWGYLGVMPLFLLFFALRRRDARTWFFFLLACAALWLALGESNPLYPLLYNVPVFNRFRVPARFLSLFTFAACFLAGTGLDELGRRLPASPRVNRWTLVAGVLAGLAVLGMVAARDVWPADAWLKAWNQLPWLWIAFAFGSILLVSRRIERSLFLTLVVGAVVLDLSLFGQPFLASIDALAPLANLTDTPRPLLAMDSTGAIYRIFTSIYNETFRLNHTWISGKQSAQIYSSLALQRNEDYLAIMSPAMLNLMNVRYYARISDPTPADKAQSGYAFDLDLFEEKADIPPTRTAQVEIVSYADQIRDVADGFLAGQVTLTSADGALVSLPLQVGVETADWAYEGWANAGGVQHSQPAESVRFPGYLVSLRRGFDGLKYIARYVLPTSLDVTGVTAHSNLPPGRLVVESVSLIDERGLAVSLAPLAHHDDLALVFKSHAVAVLENMNVLPRAFIVHETEIVADDQALSRMRMPGWVPDHVAFLSQGTPLTPSAMDDAGSSADGVTLVEYKAERVAAHVKTARSGYLILADTWYPGWEATVDGQRVPVERADYVFRAVAVPPGEHVVVFEFHPGSFYWGAALSILSLILLGGVTVILRGGRP